MANPLARTAPAELRRPARIRPAVRATLTRTGRGAGAVAVAGFLVNGLAYLVPVLGARELTAAELGALATAMAVAATAAVAGLGLQTALAVRWARAGRVDNAGSVTAATAVVATGAVAAASPVLAVVLDIPIAVMLLTALSTAAVVVASRSLGHFQGTERFGWLAVGLVLLGVGRFGGIVVALWLGAGLTAAVAVGTVIAWVVAVALVVGDRVIRTRSSLPAVAVRIRLREILVAGGATLAMLAISSADLVLARAELSADESGAYAVGSVLTKGALWAPQVVTLLILPRLAKGRSRALVIALGLVGASGIGLTLASLFAGRLAMGLAGGPAYEHLGPYAVGFAVVGSLYALVFVLVNAEIAAGVRWPAASLWLAILGLSTVVFLLPRPTLGAVLTASVVTAVAAAATTGVAAVRRLRAVSAAYSPGTVSPTEIALVQKETDWS